MIKFDLMDNFNRLFDVVEKHYGPINVEIALCEMEGDVEECLGTTVFDEDKKPKNLILINYDQTPQEMLDIIAHELAHYICGFDAQHTEVWQQTYDNIFALYQKSSEEFLVTELVQ